MASTEDEIKSLIRSRSYSTKEEVISDAIKALLKEKPELKKGNVPEERDGEMKEDKLSGEDRMKILESFVGIVKLKKPLSLEDILELEEDNWLP